MSNEVHNSRHNYDDPNTADRPVVLSHGAFPTQGTGAHEQYPQPQYPITEQDRTDQQPFYTGETGFENPKDRDPKTKRKLGKVAGWASGVTAVVAASAVTAVLLHQGSNHENNTQSGNLAESTASASATPGEQAPVTTAPSSIENGPTSIPTVIETGAKAPEPGSVTEQNVKLYGVDGKEYTGTADYKLKNTLLPLDKYIYKSKIVDENGRVVTDSLAQDTLNRMVDIVELGSGKKYQDLYKDYTSTASETSGPTAAFKDADLGTIAADCLGGQGNGAEFIANEMEKFTKNPGTFSIKLEDTVEPGAPMTARLATISRVGGAESVGFTKTVWITENFTKGGGHTKKYYLDMMYSVVTQEGGQQLQPVSFNLREAEQK